MNNYSSALINIEYCGTCHGTCKGCLMDEQERKETQPFLSKSKIIKALEDISTNFPEATGLDFSTLAFGRGNTLALGDQYWKDINDISKHYISLFKAKNYAIECSTGLIGKIEPLVTTAKQRIEENDSHLRFVVVANSDLFSESYWNNVDYFFNQMMQFRGGEEIDGNGDVLVLNLVADRLPNINHLTSRLKNYPFPVNIAWLPLTVNTPEKKEEVGHWLVDFISAMDKGQWDCNLLYLTQAILEQENNLTNSLNQHQESYSWWIDKNGSPIRSAFTVMGDVEFTRWEQKLNINLPKDFIQFYQKFSRLTSCKTCSWKNECVAAGTFLHAVASPIGTTCPTGMNKVFQFLKENPHHINANNAKAH